MLPRNSMPSFKGYRLRINGNSGSIFQNTYHAVGNVRVQPTTQPVLSTADLFILSCHEVTRAINTHTEVSFESCISGRHRLTPVSLLPLMRSSVRQSSFANESGISPTREQQRKRAAGRRGGWKAGLTATRVRRWDKWLCFCRA